MVANAISIAARQMRAGEGPGETARARLVILYGDVAAMLDDLERRLAADLRAGQFDPGATGRAAVFDHLWQTACAKAAELKPTEPIGRESGRERGGQYGYQSVGADT